VSIKTSNNPTLYTNAQSKGFGLFSARKIYQIHQREQTQTLLMFKQIYVCPPKRTGQRYRFFLKKKCSPPEFRDCCRRQIYRLFVS